MQTQPLTNSGPSMLLLNGTYTVQGCPGYQSIDKGKAIHRAREQAKSTGKAVTIYCNGEPVMTAESNYSIDGTEVRAFSINEAIAAAKRVAAKMNDLVFISVKGLRYASVDKYGKLLPAA